MRFETANWLQLLPLVTAPSKSQFMIVFQIRSRLGLLSFSLFIKLVSKVEGFEQGF
jgi:hypothetical protein